MPLNKATLKDAIRTSFDTAKSQGWSTEQIAQALADAIDAFVRSGDVKQVSVRVTSGEGAELGTGAQTGVGKVQ